MRSLCESEFTSCYASWNDPVFGQSAAALTALEEYGFALDWIFLIFNRKAMYLLVKVVVLQSHWW